MKSSFLKHTISTLLCFAVLICLISSSVTVSARYADDFEGSYEDLHCAEDDCDCLEPDSNRFKVVSPSSEKNLNNTVVFTGAYYEVQDYFSNLGQTDGLPIVPPTPLKVEKFMRYTPYNDNDIIATVNGHNVTAYQVAVNAVMSGCFAEFMPVCIAFVKAMGNDAYLESIADGSMVPMAFVNGPVARQIGIDNSQGMTTEEVNIELGRFIEFALINLAGTGNNRDNSFGSVQPLVFSENDKACLEVGWQPYHVQQGYKLNDSTVTATSFSMWGNNLTPATDLPEEIMKVIAWDITEKNLGGLGSADSDAYSNTKRTVFITPQVASALSTLYKSKEALEGDLVQNARRPLWMRTYAYYYANTGDVLTKQKSFGNVYHALSATASEDARLTTSPPWLRGITAPQIETGAVMKQGNTRFIVTGDDSRNKTQVMPGGESVTVKIELPDEWDALMTSMSYQKLSAYNLVPSSGYAVKNDISLPSVLTDGTYRILDPATGSTYLNRQGRVYFDPADDTLYYYAAGSSKASSVQLNTTENADFIAFIENLGYNSSFTAGNHKITEAVIRFSSNAKKPDKNTVNLTSESFKNISLTLHANNTKNSNAAGGVAIDGTTVIMSSSVTSFKIDLDGNVLMGESSADGFVTLNNSSVTVNTNAKAGSSAIIGTQNQDGTYRTLTFVMNASDTYTVTYHTSDTLSLTDSNVFLSGSFNNHVAEPFNKTDMAGVYTVTKELQPGEYSFEINANGTVYKNFASFTDCCDRLVMSTAETLCTMTATGGRYIFKFDTNTKKLTVSFDITPPPYTPEEDPPIAGMFNGISLTLDSDIYINFYVNLSENAAKNSRMVFTVGNRTLAADPQKNPDNGRCFFKCPLSSLEMATDVRAALSYGGNTYLLTYSVRQYIDVIINGNYSNEMKLLAKKIANYGHYAQAYLEELHPDVTIGDGGYAQMKHFTDADVNVPKAAKHLADSFIINQNGVTGTTLYGRTVYLDSATALNYYVTVDNGEEPTAYCDKEKNVKIQKYRDNIYIVSVTDITAPELADVYTVNINGVEFVGSVFDYCGAVIKNNGEESKAAYAMAALYEYYDAAVKYMQSKKK